MNSLSLKRERAKKTSRAGRLPTGGTGFNVPHLHPQPQPRRCLRNRTTRPRATQKTATSSSPSLTGNEEGLPARGAEPRQNTVRYGTRQVNVIMNGFARQTIYNSITGAEHLLQFAIIDFDRFLCVCLIKSTPEHQRRDERIQSICSFSLIALVLSPSLFLW